TTRNHRIPWSASRGTSVARIRVVTSARNDQHDAREEARMKRPMYRRAVVPLDGSAVAETILPFVLAIAGPLDLDVVLLRVVQPLPLAAIEGSRYVLADAMQTSSTDAEEYLAALAVELRNKGVRVERRVCSGSPTDEILAGARETGADLIAMTTHG